MAAGNALVSTSARQYILSDDAAIGGFVFCCRILDLDIETTRRLALDPRAGRRLKLPAKLRPNLIEESTREGGEIEL